MATWRQDMWLQADGGGGVGTGMLAQRASIAYPSLKHGLKTLCSLIQQTAIKVANYLGPE